MNLLELTSMYVQLRKASTTNGGEWHGPCPWCAGADRFHVWPEQNQGKGGFWCRSCNRGGDSITFLREKEGMTYKEACAALNIRIYDNAPRQEYKQQEFQPRQCDDPVQLWQQHAEKLVAWAQENLKKNQAVIDWLTSRGIPPASAEQYRLGWNPGDNGKDLFRARKAWGLEEILKENGKPKMLIIPRGLVIPYITDGVIQRIKIRRPEEHRTKEWDLPYYVLPGSSQATMICAPERIAFVVVEAELDAIACATSQPYVGSVAVGSSHAKPDTAAYQNLKRAVQILNSLDYDQAGTGGGKWWAEHWGGKCERWPVPQGKDPGDYARLGNNLGEWLEKGVTPRVKLEVRAARPQEPANQTTGQTHANAPICPPPARMAQSAVNPLPDIAAIAQERGLSPLIVELAQLLRKNPAVKIINRKEGSFYLRRNGKPGVGGRIHELIVKEPVVFDYILDHEDEEIDYRNFVKAGDRQEARGNRQQ